MKKYISLLLTLCLLLSLTACGAKAEAPAATAAPEAAAPETAAQTEAPAESYVIPVTDMVGRTVEIERGSYSRVVCIGAGALRLYSYVGDMNLLCGVEDIDNTSLDNRPMMFDSVSRPYVQANEALLQTLPSCGVGGPMAQTAEAEKILSCEPDIVISQYEDADKADALQEQLGVPVITLRTGADGVFAPEFTDSLMLLGEIFGGEAMEKAEKLTCFVMEEAVEISLRTEKIPEEEKPGVYICGLGNWGTTNHLMTAQVFKPFEIAGIRNIVTGLSMEGVGAIEAEKFIALGDEMDVIIMDAAAVKNIAPLYAEDPTMFDTCKAWQNGEVYLQMAYNAYYTNFEISLINTWFTAKTLYPELFEDIDITEKTNEITEAFLGQPLADAIFACPSSFGGYQKIDTANFFM